LVTVESFQFIVESLLIIVEPLLLRVDPFLLIVMINLNMNFLKNRY